MEDLTKHYLISGRVQGVGYRAFAEREARGLGLKGWVRNLADGRVEACARGPKLLLGRFEAMLRAGPASARVESLAVTNWDAQEALNDFEVRKENE